MMEAGKCLHPEIEFFWILPSSDDPDEEEWDVHGLPFHVSRALVPQGRAKPLEEA